MFRIRSYFPQIVFTARDRAAAIVSLKFGPEADSMGGATIFGHTEFRLARCRIKASKAAMLMPAIAASGRPGALNLTMAQEAAIPERRGER